MNAVIAWASGEAFCQSEGFSVYLKSLEVIDNADFYVFTHDMPDETRNKLQALNISIRDIAKADVPFLLRDRHLAYWRFVIENQAKYDVCLFTDSKDVYFQRNPFHYTESWWFDYILLVAEGMTHHQSAWNLIDQFEAQRNVREFTREYRERPVVNGGVVMGKTRNLKDFFLLLWTNGVRCTGRCTDQGILNYLWHFLEDDPVYHLKSPDRHPFCLTGEAVKEGLFTPLKSKDHFCQPITQEPYYIVHQWDRIGALAEIS